MKPLGHMQPCPEPSLHTALCPGRQEICRWTCIWRCCAVVVAAQDNLLSLGVSTSSGNANSAYTDLQEGTRRIRELWLF